MSQANRVLVVALFSYLLIILDISVVLTGLPDIREAFDLSAIGLSWVQNAYLLCFGGFLLLAARAGDHFGRKRVFLIGLGIFTASSLAIGLASSAALLIGARAVQGVGAAAAALSAMGLVVCVFALRPAIARR
ncbi:MAG: MFS transporter [Deltaproteobacteria bacterium]|nr:MFS transporter [Deltaproteobacteria bacterium]